MTDVGILVVAEGIGDATRNRFRDCIKSSQPKVSYDILIMGDIERAKNKNFNKCKLLNEGLKRLISKKPKVIIQADIDLICPPNLIDHTYALALNNNICAHCVMRRVSEEEFMAFSAYETYPFKQWSKYKAIYASGCWNGMKPDMWVKSGGYNEYMEEWGKEDTLHRVACIQRGIPWKDLHNFPLMHIDHPKRTKNLSAHNIEMEAKARAEGKTNWL